MRLLNFKFNTLAFLLFFVSVDLFSQSSNDFEQKLEVGLSSGYHHWLSKKHKDVIKPLYYIGVTGVYHYKPRLKIGSNIQYGLNKGFKEQFYISPFAELQIKKFKKSDLFIQSGIGIERSFGLTKIEFTYFASYPDGSSTQTVNWFDSKLYSNSAFIGLGGNIKLNQRTKLRYTINYVCTQNWLDEEDVLLKVEHRYKTGKSLYHGLRFELVALVSSKNKV